MAKKTGHRFEDALGYVQDFLAPAEKADFEAHLATCAECQESVAFARVFVPALNQALTAPAQLTNAQLLAMVRAEDARRVAAKTQRGWLARNWGKLALGAAVFIAVVAVDLYVENHGHGDVIAAPTPERYRAHPDGGDGGK
jgi:anti-sigma factor RsiW